MMFLHTFRNQLYRYFYDDGRNDKDFKLYQDKLALSRSNLQKCTEEFNKAISELQAELLLNGRLN